MSECAYLTLGAFIRDSSRGCCHSEDPFRIRGI